MSKTGNASCRGQALRGDTADQKSQRSLKEVKPKPWTLESDVRDILLEGLTPPEDLMPSELGGTYDDTLMVVNNAPISEFFMNQQCHSDQPEQRQTAVNPDCHMYRLVEKDCALLNSIGVRDLGQWVEQDGLLKHGISTFTVSRLDAVWSLVKVELDSAAKLKARNDKAHREYARYTSVHRASWGYVESGHTDEPLGLKIFEGYPASVWTAEEVCVTPLLREIDNELPRPTGLEILVLSSKLGWPGTRFRHDASESGAGTHVYVNREMMRVWYLVEQGLDRWFEQKDGTANPWIVTCTPGSGRTHGLSSFLLHQLLNYRDGELVVVAFLTRTIAYLMYTEEYRYAGYVVSLFDQKEALLRIKETVSAQRRGYIVVDLCDEMSSLYRRLPVAHCGTLLLTGPEEKYYEEWSEYMNYGTVVMNCSDARDIKAFFAWETLRSLPAGWRLDEQQKADVIRKMEEGWDVVEERINLVGPLPCFVFDEDACRAHLARLVSAIPYTSDADAGHSIHVLQKDATWKSADTRRILLKLVRYRDADFEGDFHKCRLLSPLLRYAVAVLSLVRLERSNAKRCIALPPPVDRGDWIGTDMCGSLLFPEVLRVMVPGLEYLKREGEQIERQSVLVDVPPRQLRFTAMMRLAGTEQQIGVCKCAVLYRLPACSRLPVNGFFFMERYASNGERVGSSKVMSNDGGPAAGSGAPARTIVLLRDVPSRAQILEAEMVVHLWEALGRIFSDWGTASTNMEWEIVHMQRPDGARVEGRQLCAAVPSERGSAVLDDACRFWDGTVNQYHVCMEENVAFCRRGQSTAPRIFGQT